jgi:multiple sugar transport system ATP-binding protein
VRSVARAELRDLHARTGITVLYVTHDQLEALGLGDRVAVMHGGRVRQVGKPQELYFDPADTFVARFVGNPPMNLIERGDRVLGIRCEHFVLREAAAGDPAELSFRIRVDQLQFLGAEWLAYGAQVQGEGEHAARIVVRLSQDEGYRLQAGRTYGFTVARRHVRAFDRASGRRAPPVRA